MQAEEYLQAPFLTPPPPSYIKHDQETQFFKEH